MDYCAANCIKCDALSSCMFCADGYYLSGVENAKTCAKCASYCRTCVSEFDCIYCADGYNDIATPGKCVLTCAIENCVTCKSGVVDDCHICDAKYYPVIASGKTFCSPCKTGCATCENDTTCLTCDDGYIDEGYGVCVSNTCRVENCVYCSSLDIYDCIACADGYYAFAVDGQRSCSRCSASCATCTNEVTCTACAPGYVDAAGNGICVSHYCPADCKTCTEPTSCTECNLGFYLDGAENARTCAKCSEHCESCISASFCTACSTGYAGADCAKIECPVISNCELCRSTTECAVCVPRFTGVACSECAPGHSGADCALCDEGYQISPAGDKCVPICTTGIERQPRECKCGEALCPAGQICHDGNCTECTTDYDCKKNQYCEQRESMCKDFYTSPVVCYNGSQCARNKFCYWPGITQIRSCGMCRPYNGLFPNYTYVNVHNCNCGAARYCNNCDATLNACQDCIEHYAKVNGACEHMDHCVDVNCVKCDISASCRVCVDGYYLTGENVKTCAKCDETCKTCENGTRCLTCANGYTYVEHAGICVSECAVANCRECEAGSLSDCKTCNDGFTIVGSAPAKTCVPTAPPSCVNGYNNCVTCRDATDCQTCDTGYETAGPAGSVTCAKIACPSIQNCDLCASETDCETCAAGFEISGARPNRACVPIYAPSCAVANCRQCRPGFPGQCAVCNDGFYIANYEYTLCQPCKATCATCDNGIRCLTCAEGYEEAGMPSICYLACKVPNCDLCHTDQPDSCKYCDKGFYAAAAAGEKTTCAPCMTGCATCANGTSCTSCLDGYADFGSTGVCAPICQVPGCNTCEIGTPYDCKTCNEGYQLVRDQAVKKCELITCVVQDCAECEPGLVTNCRLCNSEFYLVGTAPYRWCYSIYAPPPCAVENCKQCWHGNELDCAECEDGYWQPDRYESKLCDKILCDDHNCDLCFSNDNCKICIQGYTTTGDEYYKTCMPDCLNEIPRCATCQTYTICNECVRGYTGAMCNECDIWNGYVTDGAGGCMIGCYVDNCVICEDGVATDCKTCVGGYEIAGTSPNKTCVPVVTLPTCTVEHCAACENGKPDSCETCNDMFYPDLTTAPGKPVCAVCPVNCAKCTSVTNCTTCIVGYVGHTCNECDYGYVSGTDPNTCVLGCGEGCKTCIDNKCVTCNDAYFATGDAGDLTCTPCPVNCTGCSSQNSCYECNTGYTGAHCDVCKNGYWKTSVNPAPLVCEKIDCSAVAPNCAICVSDTSCYACNTGFTGDTCATCAPGFTGVQCDSCDAGYEKTSTDPEPLKCEKIACNDPYCDFCLTAGNCQTCKPGFTMTGEENKKTCMPNCLATIPYCAICTSAVECGRCNTGYYNPFTQCKEMVCADNVYNCISCTAPNGTKCKTCEPGYKGNAVSGICVPDTCPANCKSCANMANCDECEAGYYLTGDADSKNCAKCSANCAICESASDCSSCSPGFYLSTSTNTHAQCTACASTCATCSDGNSCLNCLTGYEKAAELSMCTKIACNDSNCAICADSATCVECNEQYALTNAGKCAGRSYIGLVVGASVGAAVLVIALAVVLIWYFRRQAARKTAEDATGSDVSAETHTVAYTVPEETVLAVPKQAPQNGGTKTAKRTVSKLPAPQPKNLALAQHMQPLQLHAPQKTTTVAPKRVVRQRKLTPLRQDGVKLPLIDLAVNQ